MLNSTLVTDVNNFRVTKTKYILFQYISFNLIVWHLFAICDNDTHKIAALVTVNCYFGLMQKNEEEIRGNSIICSFTFLLLFTIYQNNETLKTGPSALPGLGKKKNYLKLLLTT